MKTSATQVWLLLGPDAQLEFWAGRFFILLFVFQQPFNIRRSTCHPLCLLMHPIPSSLLQHLVLHTHCTLDLGLLERCCCSQ